MADTKFIFNQGKSPYTYPDPKTGKPQTLAPNAGVELPSKIANMLLVYSKDIIDTAMKVKTIAVGEVEGMLKEAKARITELEGQLQKVLASIASSEKSNKGDK